MGEMTLSLILFSSPSINPFNTYPSFIIHLFITLCIYYILYILYYVYAIYKVVPAVIEDYPPDP